MNYDQQTTSDHKPFWRIRRVENVRTTSVSITVCVPDKYMNRNIRNNTDRPTLPQVGNKAPVWRASPSWIVILTSKQGTDKVTGGFANHAILCIYGQQLYNTSATTWIAAEYFAILPCISVMLDISKPWTRYITRHGQQIHTLTQTHNWNIS